VSIYIYASATLTLNVVISVDLLAYSAYKVDTIFLNYKKYFQLYIHQD